MRAWRTPELRYIRDNHKTTSIEDMADYLDRTSKSVRRFMIGQGIIDGISGAVSQTTAIKRSFLERPCATRITAHWVQGLTSVEYR